MTSRALKRALAMIAASELLVACGPSVASSDDGGSTSSEATGDPSLSDTATATSTISTTSGGTDVDTGSPDDVPPELERVAFLSNTELQLSFSEPIAVVGDFLASRFRLSIAIPLGRMTRYYDPGFFFDSVETSCCDYCYDFYYQDEWSCVEIPCPPEDPYCIPCWDCTQVAPIDPHRIVGLVDMIPEDEHLTLTFEQPFTDPACSFVDDGANAQIFVHYESSDVAVYDLAGNQLGPIGANWVGAGAWFLDVAGTFADLDPFLPIPECGGQSGP